MPYNLTQDPPATFLKLFILLVAWVLEQPASETLVHNVMTILQLCHGDTIITSHNNYVTQISRNMHWLMVTLVRLRRVSDHVIGQ